MIGPYDVFAFQGVDDEELGSKRDFAFAVCSSAVYEWDTYFSLRLVSARCGLFDESATEILPLNFDGVAYLGQGRAAVAFGNPPLDPVKPSRLEAPKTRVRLGRNGKFESYADERRDVVTSIDTRVVGMPGDKRRWGLVEIPGGRPLGNPVFERIGEFKDGLAVATLGGKEGYLGLDGKWVLDPVFTSAYAFQGALARVRKDDRDIYIDKSGKEVAVADDGTRDRPGHFDDLPDTKAPATSSASNVRLGTGFFVSEFDVVTNAHVVADCSRVENAVSNESAQKVLVDKHLDLALVRFGQKSPAFLRIRNTAPELGEPVAVFGYPLDGVLSSSGVATFGNVSALSGIGDRTDIFQMSAQIGPGSSGGPIMDTKGSVIGVVVSRLDDRKLVAATGAVPQNANFAVKGTSLSSFLAAHGVTPPAPQFWQLRRSQEDLSNLAKGTTTRLRCVR